MTELEVLAVMFGLHYYKYMIQGCDITVVTDHVALKFLMDWKEPRSNRLFRWRLEVADFEVLGGKIRFEYKKGSEHKVPDSLSHFPVGSPDEFWSEEEKWIAVKAKVVAVDPLN